MLDPIKVRASRYNIVIRNLDLCTLLEGELLAERIPTFLLEFFREKTNFESLKTVQHVYVMKANFFETLIPPGGILDLANIHYNDVRQWTNEFKGKGNTIFEKFARILIGILLSANNFILVEIRSRPEKEILVYDSDFSMFSIYHEKIVKCIRAYIIEEYRNKTDSTEGESIEFAKEYIGKSVNCP